MYRIEVQTQIKVQGGEFPKINKRAVRNKRAGETSCKKIVKLCRTKKMLSKDETV